MADKPNLTPELLRQLISYDPETGVLLWKERDVSFFRDTEGRSAAHACANWNSRYAGTPALNSPALAGYREGDVFKVRIQAQRAAWMIHHGETPDTIDHINGDRSDNRLMNIRNGTQTDNMRNIKRNRLNTSGQMGVAWDRSKGKWMAYIRAGKRIHLGRYDRIEDAIIARKAAEKRFGFHENHGRIT